MRLHLAPWVLPIVGPPIADGAVALDERGVVRGVGRRVDLRASGEEVPHDGILLPGLVNAHAHLELSGQGQGQGQGMIRGGDGLAPWIRRLLEARRAPDAVAIEAAAQQMYQRGTIAVADVANTPIAAPIARAAGLEVLDLDERVALDGEVKPPRAGAMLTPHATYTCGEEAVRQIAAVTGGRIVSIHLEEDPAEAGYTVEGAGPLAELLRERGLSVRKVGQRPLGWLDSLGVIGEGTLLVHLTFADDDSLALAHERRAVAVLCPRSNQHITGHLPPFARMHAMRVALGTDSLASSPSLDLFGEIQCLARAGADPSWLLHAATAGGAAALGKPHLGALAPGRRPSLVCVQHRAKDPLEFLAHEAADAPVERVA